MPHDDPCDNYDGAFDQRGGLFTGRPGKRTAAEQLAYLNGLRAARRLFPPSGSLGAQGHYIRDDIDDRIATERRRLRKMKGSRP